MRLLALAVLSLLVGCSEPAHGEAPAAASDEAPAAASNESPLAQRLSPERMTQWKLPKRLKEISGLAVTAEGGVFAVDDERAHVHRLDIDEGRIAYRFRVGDPTLRGDFEGITVADDRFYLVTSDGVLYAFAEGGDDERVPFERIDTGAACEIEGLETDPGARSLLLACKEPTQPGRVQLLRWWLDDARLELAFDAPVAPFAEAVRERDFSPSALAYDANDDTLLVLAARERGVASFTSDGEGGFTLREVMRLPARRSHRQSEALAILEDQTVLIGDEGGDGRARLARYGASQ